MCMRNPKNPLVGAIDNGDVPALKCVFDNPQFQQAYPMYKTLLEELNVAVPRPKTPLYQNISTIVSTHAVAAGLDRPGEDGGQAQGLHPDRRSTGRGSCRDHHPSRLRRERRWRRDRQARRASEGKRAERRLGLLLCAPAVIVMLAVCRLPDPLRVLAVVLHRADLRTPDANEFIGLENYVTVLTSSDLVGRVLGHADHHGGQRGLRAGASAWCWRSSCTARSSAAGWCAPRPWCPTRSSPSWPRSRGGSPGPRGSAGWPVTPRR